MQYKESMIGSHKLIEDQEDKAIIKAQSKEEEPVSRLKQMSGGDSKRKMLNILNVFYGIPGRIAALIPVWCQWLFFVFPLFFYILSGNIFLLLAVKNAVTHSINVARGFAGRLRFVVDLFVKVYVNA